MPPTCAIASMISTPGMIGCPGKCPWKNGSLIVTFLMPDDPLPALDLEDPVHQQERVAVRDDVEDLADVHRDPARALPGAGDGAGQRDVALVAGPGGHDVGLDPAADQGEVADEVGRLVAHELVRPAERGALGEPGVGQHHRVGRWWPP